MDWNVHIVSQIPQIPGHIYVGWLRRHYATGRCLCWSRLNKREKAEKQRQKNKNAGVKNCMDVKTIC